jgi:ABC-type Zn2+ transport system substrate-binding protein/surface adhesin
MILLLAPFIWLLSHFRIALAKRIKVIAVVAITAGLALAPMPLASAHDPLALAAAESARHAALAAQETAEHGHSHDDGEAHEQSDGHLHGHDPADHSHQFAFFAGSASQWGLPLPQRWPSSRSGTPDPATGFGIDRPPKQAMSL